MPRRVLPGLERISQAWPKRLRGCNAGLVAHPASVDTGLAHATGVLGGGGPFRLTAIFGPQHGIRGETQDNMVEWEGFRDKTLGIPVFSLYGKTRKPDASMLGNLDVMVIDLQDVGARYYTFIWTMALIMEACAEQGKAVAVLDRPNPLGGLLTEGPMLDPRFRSFVGLQRLPVRHGMTIGEIALYLRQLCNPRLELHVIRMKGWRRRMWFDQTGLPWVMPSPNMPTLDTATVYPGMCLLEGTNLSEGRGTTRPFEIFGAPFVDPDLLAGHLNRLRLAGVFFRPLHFLPTFQKHSGRLCGGCQIHVTDKELFRPFRTAAAVIKSIRELYPGHFRWNKPPYEYERRLLPIDILAGSDRFRKEIEAGIPLKEMSSRWRDENSRFDKNTRGSFLLYR